MIDEPNLGNITDLPAPRNLADAVERLMSVLFWLDANGFSWAVIDLNDAIEKLLAKSP